MTYYDFKKVLNKYQDKKDTDYTLPQPFEFQKDSKSRINGANRLKKFLEERKEIEDKMLAMKKLQEQMFLFSFIKEDEEIQRIKMEKQKIY